MTLEETKQAGFTLRLSEKIHTVYYTEEAHGVLELHVDDGHGTGRPEVIRGFLQYLGKRDELKWVDG